MGSYCSWKCFATGLLVGTLCFITIAMIGGLVAIPVVYVRCTTSDYHQYSIVYAAEPDCANLSLYRWDSRKKSHNTAVFDQPYYTCHVSDGVDLAVISSELSSYCLPRLLCSDGNGNKRCMPKRDNQLVHFYFLATRELYTVYNSSDYMAEVDEYSKNVTGIISQYLNNGKSHSITLNESEQSIATWITGNVEHLQQTDKHSSTSGVLYLGIALVQLSKNRKGDQTISSSLSQLDLYGRNYSIYSDSRWCNGSEEIWKIITINANKSGNGHDCLPSGYNWTVNGSDLSSVCTNISINSSVNYTFQGTGDYHQCEQLIDNLTTMQHEPPTAGGDYIAVGKFIEVMKFFNTTHLNSTAGWGNYNQTLERFCQHDWTIMRMMYNESASQLSRKCYEGLLVRSLLMKAYGFNSKSSWNISFINGMDGNTWSLGYMLEETKNITSTPPHKERPYSKTSLILSLVELVILLVLFSLFLISVIHVSCSDKHKNGYIAIS